MSQIERATKRQEERAAELLARVEGQHRIRPKIMAIAVRDALMEYGRWLRKMKSPA